MASVHSRAGSVGAFYQRQQLIAEPRHVLLDREGVDDLRRPRQTLATGLLPGARGCPAADWIGKLRKTRKNG